MRPTGTRGRLAPLIDHLSTEILTENGQFERRQGEWERLFNSWKNPRVYQSFTRNYKWWNGFGKPFELGIITVRERGKLLGIGPFMVREWLGRPQVEPIGSNQHAYFGLLVGNSREDIAEAIAAQFVKSFQRGLLHMPYYAAGNTAIDNFMGAFIVF